LFFPLCCCNESGCYLHSLSVIDEAYGFPDPEKHYRDWEAYRQKFGTRAKFYILQTYHAIYDTNKSFIAGPGGNEPYQDGITSFGPHMLFIPNNYDGAAPVTVLRDSVPNGGTMHTRDYSNDPSTTLEPNLDNPTGFPTNWYEGLNFANTVNEGDKVSLFIDDSGSMRAEEVKLSRQLFLEMLANHVAADTGEDYPITEENDRLLFVVNSSQEWIEPHLSITCSEAGEVTQEDNA